MVDEVETMTVTTGTDRHHEDSSRSKSTQSALSSFIGKMKRGLSLVDLEPAIFLQEVVIPVSSIMVNEFLFYKACVVNQDLTEDYCSRNKTKDDQVAEVVADIKICREVIDSVFSVVVFLLIGSWSDLFGRRVPVLMGMGGYFTQIIGVLICLFFQRTTAEVTAVITIIPMALTAGPSAVNIGAYSYAADRTCVKDRTLKMAVILTSLSMGVVPREELGKILAFTFLGRNLTPLVMDPTYAAIFRWTMNSFPGAFFIVSTAVSIIYLYFHFATHPGKEIAASTSSNDNESSQNFAVETLATE